MRRGRPLPPLEQPLRETLVLRIPRKLHTWLGMLDGTRSEVARKILTEAMHRYEAQLSARREGGL